MTRPAWVRLDNASNIFLAARSDVDPKVFRLSAEMDHEVDPQLLQEALDATYDRYRLYHAVLRSGVFWYYLQESDLHPLVTAEEQHTCAPLCQADRRSLLFRVMHHHRRIILEVDHARRPGDDIDGRASTTASAASLEQSSTESGATRAPGPGHQCRLRAGP